MRPIKLVMLISILIFESCAKIYYSPNAYSIAQSHKLIAVIPPTVSIAANKNVDAKSMKEQQRTESTNFQQEIYSWMLTRKMQGKITQDILDIDQTNFLLNKAGFSDSLLSVEDICRILNVDGIIKSNFSLSKPISDGGAVVLALFGAYGSTNEIHVSMNIHDRKTNKLIWNFDHKFSGTIGSSPSRLVDALMRYASKKMPYMILN